MVVVVVVVLVLVVEVVVVPPSVTLVLDELPPTDPRVAPVSRLTTLLGTTLFAVLIPPVFGPPVGAPGLFGPPPPPPPPVELVPVSPANWA